MRVCGRYFVSLKVDSARLADCTSGTKFCVDEQLGGFSAREETRCANLLVNGELAGGNVLEMSVDRFQFGEFEFDSEKHVLMHRGREVRLQAQPALLLGALLSRRNQVVSREELKLVLWGTDTHVDFEKGLNFCIGQVRTALWDDASRPLYIRTVPNHSHDRDISDET